MNFHFSHVLWIGAGTATEPKELLRFCEKATLYEARSDAAQELRKILSAENVLIENQYISAEGGTIEFNYFNLETASASKPPKDLLNLYPNLCLLGTESIETTSITQVVENLNLGCKNNLLILDTPAINFELINALTRSGQLYLFHTIYIHTGLMPLYANSADARSTQQQLQSIGFELFDSMINDERQPWLIFKSKSIINQMERLVEINRNLRDEVTALRNLISEKSH